MKKEISEMWTASSILDTKQPYSEDTLLFISPIHLWHVVDDQF